MNDISGKTRDADATQKALLEAATALFAVHGFEGCRNQQIADAAGANKAMINYHFDGKLGLYRSVVTEAVLATRPLVDAFRDKAPGLKTSERLGAWIHTLDACFRNQPHLPALLLREHMEGGKRLQREFQEHVSRFYKTTAWVLAHSGGALDPKLSGDAHKVHLSLVGALTFFLVSQPFRDQAGQDGTEFADPPEHKHYIDYLVRLFQGGLRQP